VAVLRCGGKIHAVTTDDGLIEVRCTHIACTRDKRAIVNHYFDPDTGQLKYTSKPFRNPMKGTN